MSNQTFIKEIDLTGDGGIIKKIIKEGNGITPKQGQNVVVHYVGTLQDGKVFDSSRDRDEPFEFVLGKGTVIKAWETALETMSQGEISLLIAKPEYAYGASGSPPTIPPNSTLNFEVELLRFEDREKEVFEMTFEERLEFGLKFKEEGNSLFKSNEFKEAILKYEKALTYFVDKEEAFEFTEEQKNQFKQNESLCNLNIAACHLKLKNYKKAIKSCDKVLEKDTKNIKALYRRGQAYLEELDYDLATKDFQKILEFSPDNKEAKNGLSEIKKRQSIQDQKEKKIYGNLFQRLNKIEQQEEEERKKKIEQEKKKKESEESQQEPSISSAESN